MNPKRYFAESITIGINSKISDREKQSFIHFIFCIEAIRKALNTCLVDLTIILHKKPISFSHRSLHFSNVLISNFLKSLTNNYVQQL